SVASLQKFTRYLEEAYLFVNLPRYSTKIKSRQTSALKTYCIDNGFIKARAFELSPNYGRLLENMVLVELLRRDYKPGLGLFYYHTRNNKEVDFVIRNGHKAEALIQVCYDLSAVKTRKREQDALLEAARETGCSELLILSWNEEAVVEKEGNTIHIVPVYKWLLNKG
ncbi:MAG: ATP-binding protein, partial [Burkholderiales bacterium]